jgi:predicted anti-sigma-YlaC factor YlaD
MRYAMKCHSIQKKLSAYQDGELKPQEQNEIRSHLLKCRSCAEQYEKLERVWQTLGQLDEIGPDPWFYPQLVRKIGDRRQNRRFVTLRQVYRWLPASAIVSVLLVVGLLAGTYLGNILARCDFLPFSSTQTSRSSQETTLSSLQVFDPVSPGTVADGYLRTASYTEGGSR